VPCHTSTSQCVKGSNPLVSRHVMQKGSNPPVAYSDSPPHSVPLSFLSSPPIYAPDCSSARLGQMLLVVLPFFIQPRSIARITRINPRVCLFSRQSEALRKVILPTRALLEALRKVIFKENHISRKKITSPVLRKEIHFSGRKSLSIFGGRPMPKAFFAAFARQHEHKIRTWLIT
jgi:hypothetical protein